MLINNVNIYSYNLLSGFLQTEVVLTKTKFWISMINFEIELIHSYCITCTHKSTQSLMFYTNANQY